MAAAQVEAELRAVLDEVESAYARGVPPAELMPMWYDQSDVVVVGQGESCASRGFPAVLAQALQKAPLIGERPQVAFRIDSPIVVADGLAVAMIDCDAVPDYPAADRMQLRLLTVWCRRPDGWRIVREMFSEGSL
jgi:ketosteroid isomerase-like protein